MKVKPQLRGVVKLWLVHNKTPQTWQNNLDGVLNLTKRSSLTHLQHQGQQANSIYCM